MKIWMLSAVILLASSQILAVKVDMGQCACNCSYSLGATMSSHFLGGVQNGKFYESIRGLKGEMGRPGDVGVAGPAGTPGDQGSRGPPAVDISKPQPGGSTLTSCADLQTTTDATPGIYTIKPRGSNQKIQVYCDTTSAGGGWTLVASIHENNIYGKCTVGDNWSYDQGISIRSNLSSLNNWENFNTFGHPEGATSSDYKSAAYFSLSGDNVMVWHVPNDSEMSQWRTSATLKYYTNNNFLSNYGGSLQAMFSKYFQVQQQANRSSSSPVVAIANRLAQNAGQLRDLVPNFYSYRYDSSNDMYISDGGNDMYDTGNRVFFKIGERPFTQIIYEKEYTDFASGTQVYSKKSHPFITYMWIPNTSRSVESFSLKVTSGTGADSGGSYDSQSSVITQGNFSCSYNVYNVFRASDPSICEIYFYCYSETLWNSIPANTFTRTVWSSSTDGLQNGVSVNGRPKSILLGYTLLSRLSGVKVTSEQVQAVLSRMMTDFQSVTTFPDIDCARLNESLAIPIEYLQGNNDTVMHDIPPTQKSYVTPGFLHFRPIDIGGRPNALCPGIISKSCNPSYVCVGGIGADSRNSAEVKRACGDFAGWQGNPGDNATATVPSGSARPLNNLETTLLVFTR